MTGWHRSIRRLAAVAACAALLAACGGSPSGSGTPADATGSGVPGTASTMPGTAGTPSTAPAPTTAPAARLLDGAPMTACRVGSLQGLCGDLAVPEDPAKPGGRTIELRVAVIPAVAAVPEPDPVFMLAGGPGAAATESMAWTSSAFRGIHATRDIVLVDQRGTGGSNALWLDAAPDLGALSAEEADRTLRDWVAGQLDRFDGDPRLYTTTVAMDDLEAVRVALGYDRINLYGASYGATAAQYAIRQHAGSLRSVVLDGATLIDVPIFEGIAAASQRALDLVFARCAREPACAAAYPTLERDFGAVLDALAGEAVATDVVDPATGEPVVIDHALFTSAIHGALLTADTAASVPWVVDRAAAGRWDDVARAFLAASGGRPPAAVPLMSAEIRCSEAWAAFDPDDVARRGEGSYYLAVQLETARSQAAACRYAPPGVVPFDDGAPARASVPVLLLVGEADPQDPPANVADAAEDFPNSVTVVVPGQGHTVAHLGCLPTIVDAFVAAGSAEGLDTSCVAAGGVPVPPFRLP